MWWVLSIAGVLWLRSYQQPSTASSPSALDSPLIGASHCSLMKAAARLLPVLLFAPALGYQCTGDPRSWVRPVSSEKIPDLCGKMLMVGPGGCKAL